MTIEEQELYICRALKKERERINMSQLELSYESGVSQNMITYIENGKRTPTIKTILKLCSALKINPAVLFPRKEEEKKMEKEREDAKQTVLKLINQFM